MAGKNTPAGTRKPPGKSKGGNGGSTAITPMLKQGGATLVGAGVSTVAAEVGDNALGTPKADETTKRQVVTGVIAAVAGTSAAFVASKIKATRKYAGAVLGGTVIAVGARVAPALKELGRMIADKFKKAEPGTPGGSGGISRERAGEAGGKSRIRDLVN